DALEAGAWILEERPAFGTVIARRLRSIERRLALAPIEAADVAAGQPHPHPALAVDVAAASAKAGQRHGVDLGQRGLRRIRSGHKTNNGARIAERGSPNRAVHRTRHH